MLSLLEQNILDLINEYRKSKALLPLVFDKNLQHEAFSHSQQMANRTMAFGHQGFSERANRLLLATGGIAAAENLAFGAADAQKIVQNWIQSEGHRKNLEGDYNLSGISACVDSVGNCFVTQIFIKSPKHSKTLLSDTEGKELAQQLFLRINQHRVSVGLQPLTWTNAIAFVAETHSEDMAQKTTPFGHDGFERRAGLLLNSIGGRGLAENVAKGKTNIEQIAENWLQSEGHRKNIEGDYQQSGIGFAQDEHGVSYYTQIFLLEKPQIA